MRLDLSKLKTLLDEMEGEESLTYVAVLAGDKRGGICVQLVPGQYAIMGGPGHIKKHMAKAADVLGGKYLERTTRVLCRPWFDMEFIQRAYATTISRGAAIKRCMDESKGKANPSAIALVLDSPYAAKVPKANLEPAKQGVPFTGKKKCKGPGGIHRFDAFELASFRKCVDCGGEESEPYSMRTVEEAENRPCPDPDKMHGAGDGFGGSDY